jgi:hypothetical protein
MSTSAHTRRSSSKTRRKAPERARYEWLRRVEAEYRSAATTQELTLWLIQIGASPDLIDAGLRIVKDELKHAELSHRAFIGGGGEGGPELARETLSLHRNAADPLELDVARVAVDVFCLGETIAVRLFKELRQRCTVPVARRVLDRVLIDEVRHRDFGWSLFAWLLETPSAPAVRAMIERELPGYFQRIRAVYAPERVSPHVAAPLSGDELGWGLMPIEVYAAMVKKTFELDYVPRFRKLGFDAKAAWEAPAHESALARPRFVG